MHSWESSFCLSFSHGFSFQGDGVGVVDKSVKDGVAQSWVADGFVPVFDGLLGGDERGPAVIAVFGDLEEVPSLFIRQGHRLFLAQHHP